MLVPVYGFTQGDSMGVVVLAQDTDTVEHLGVLLAQACEMRVGMSHAAIWVNGKQVDPTITLAEAGIDALCRVDLRDGAEQAPAHPSPRRHNDNE
jgi:hypothetical protein